MSRFDAAASKASTKSAAKPATKAAAKASATSAVASKKGPVLNTIEEKKKFVRQHELKIEDAEEQAKDEPDKSKRKTLENDLKKLKEDETYMKTTLEVKEAAAQAVRDAERAAVTAKAAPTAKAGEKAAEPEKKNAKEAAKRIDLAVLAEIDAAFAGTGKDAAAAKVSAVQRLEENSSSTPYVVPRIEKLISLFADSKLGAPAVKAASAIVSNMQPPGHGVASFVIPALLIGMDDKKWKTKAGCIEVLLPALKEMEEATPAQLGRALPLIVPRLAEAALEVRAEIRTATKSVLQEIGSLVASPEIKKLSQDLVTALAEPTNQKHTQGVLAMMGNQTFLSLIDAASLSLLMPVIVRGLKERDSASRKWSAQIFGSLAILVADVEFIRPYLKTVVPLLQDALTNPVAEVQREGAKAFGVLEQVLPDYSRQHNQPWLFNKLRNGSVGEQMGASLALAEVLLKMNKAGQEELMPAIEVGTLDEKASVRRGFLELMDAGPQAMKMDYVPYIMRTFPTMLMGINGDKERDEDAGHRAALSLVQRFGDLCPELLLPGIEAVYVATLHSDTSEGWTRNQVVREKVAAMLGKTVDKMLEHKRFGQDLLGTEDCSTKETREHALCLLLIMRSDPDAGVKRQANGSWKNAGGAPKVVKAIAPRAEKMLLKMREGASGLGAQKVAKEVLAQLVAEKNIEEVSGDEPEVASSCVFKATGDLAADSVAACIVSGKEPDRESESAAGLRSRAATDTTCLLESQKAFHALPEDVRSHCSRVAASIVSEGKKKRLSGPKMAHLLVENLETVVKLGCDSATVSTLGAELPAAAEAICRAALGNDFDAKAGQDDDDSEVLLRNENLLLCYGAGHLLLKDTMFEMRRNQRYGVVGQNGAGKTTLMKEIAGHRIVGMDASLKCVHVDDSKLGLMSKSCLTSLEYVIKMAKDIGVHDAGRETLLGVGFGEKMVDEPVSELSTGWRMRLTLAVSMLKHADLVLLDEPTNHLDEQSVEWLANYILSITGSSVMVISHEPKFLNKVCTHILAYKDKKLETTAGNFDAFVARKGLTKEQIEKMLSGNLSFDEEVADEDGEEGGEKKAEAPKVMAGPPKLSFPIPGAMEGVKSGSRAVLEAKNVSFRYSADKEYLVSHTSIRLSLNSRVAICGRNGCGKSTFMTLLCSESNPSENKDGKVGEVWRHCNLRMAYMKQDHLKALGPFFETSPFVYISTRFKEGYDGDLQKRLVEPEDDEEATKRKQLAKEFGKYGNEVEELVSRSKVGTTLSYEVRWKGLDDPKQNTLVTIATLKQMGLEKVVIACDERIAAKAAGLDQRPLTRREISKHCESFGIDEEMCCNRQIQGFSAGQKVRLSLSAMFWTKPHLIALDEPTNYLDVETVEALAKALNTFRGGIVMIEPKTDFVERICNEKWHMEDGNINVEKLNNNVKRQA